MAEISFYKRAPQKNAPPFNPYVYIWVMEHTEDSEGRIFISPQLICEEEIDWYVDYLIEQLNNTRKKAKAELKKLKKQSTDRKTI